MGDHDHYALYYICSANNPEELQINSELLDAKWFSSKDLESENIPQDVREQAQFALESFKY